MIRRDAPSNNHIRIQKIEVSVSRRRIKRNALNDLNIKILEVVTEEDPKFRPISHFKEGSDICQHIFPEVGSIIFCNKIARTIIHFFGYIYCHSGGSESLFYELHSSYWNFVHIIWPALLYSTTWTHIFSSLCSAATIDISPHDKFPFSTPLYIYDLIAFQSYCASSSCPSTKHTIGGWSSLSWNRPFQRSAAISHAFSIWACP